MVVRLALVLCALVAGQSVSTRSESPPLQTVREALRYLRERAGLSARSLSVQAGLSPSYVGKIESGEHLPSLTGFAAMVTALHLSPYEVWTLVHTAATHPEGVTPAEQDGPGE